MKYRFVVSEDFNGRRLDKFLAEQIQVLSRSEVQTNIARERAQVNGKVVSRKGYILSAQDVVELRIDEPPLLPCANEDIPLDIRYEDRWLLVLNKPAGMVVHPAPGHAGGTLVNALLGYGIELSDLGGEFRPGIVHRLDKETSGLLIIAKTNPCHLQLAAMFKEREIQRVYLALVAGRVPKRAGRITGPIGRHPRLRTKMAVVNEGKPAVTDFRVLQYYPKHTLVEVKLLTGRTHQIRVHFAQLGNPVVGDAVYGKKAQDKKYTGQMLHARTLKFIHPILRKEISVTAEPPPEFLGILRELAGAGKKQSGTENTEPDPV
jgi:23S rRNA pseudouridine1911/1915/1917 synthase